MKATTECYVLILYVWWDASGTEINNANDNKDAPDLGSTNVDRCAPISTRKNYQLSRE